MAARAPTASSSTPATVTVFGVAQSPPAPPVKVSDAGLTVTAPVLDVPSAPRACGVTVTGPVGFASSRTV